MNKKLIITLICILIVSIAGTMTANAVFDINDSKASNVSNNYHSVRTDIPQTKTLTLADGKEKNLTYIETYDSQSSKTYWDEYKDEDDVKYTFGKNGKLIGISKLDYTPDLSKTAYSEKQLSEIAEQYAKELFKEDFEGFKFVSSLPMYDDNKKVESYLFEFSKCHGENGFVRGPICCVDVAVDGKVTSCVLSAYGTLDGFNPDTLNGITLKDVENYVDDLVKNTYTTNLVSYELDFVKLAKENDKFVLLANVIVEYTVNNNPEPWSIAESYYYEIPQ